MNSRLTPEINMLHELNERLTIAKANHREKRKLDAMLCSTQSSLAAEKIKRNMLKRSLAKEQSDVDALEGLSLTGLFYTMLGSKEQRLDQERQELVSAKLKYDQTTDTISELDHELKRLQDALSHLKNAESEYEQVLAEKAQYLAGNDSETATNLLELTQQIADLNADQKELLEAAEAGKSALKSLEEIQSTLNSAANWGALDMFGGGMLATMAKHSKMDAAKEQARNAQRKLLRFEEELADADERLRVSLQIDGFSTFADYFFDGLIADWIVQSKIQTAKSACTETATRIRSAMLQCEIRRDRVKSELSMLTERKRELIESA